MKKSLILCVSLVLAIAAYAVSRDRLMKKGTEAFQKGEYDKAISFFIEASETYPQDGDCFRWLGGAYCKTGQFQNAVDAIKQALRLPHLKEYEFDSLDLLTNAYRGLGQLDLAIASRKKFIELKPDDAEGFWTLSELYLSKSQSDEAITAAKRAIELKPDSTVAYFYLGTAYGMKEQYAEATSSFKKAIEIDPDMYPAYSLMAKFFIKQGHYAEAIEAYKNGINTAPSVPDLHADLAAVYFLTGKYDEAMTEVDRALELEKAIGSGPQQQYQDKASASAHIALRSCIHRYNGSLEKAFQDAEKAYSLDPTNEEARRSLGAANLDKGKFDAAIVLLAQVKSSPLARILEAIASAKLGKLDEAAQIYISIPEDALSPQKIPLMSDRKVLLQLFEPMVRELRENALSLATTGLHKEALSKLSEALKIADDSEILAIREAIFLLLRKNPSLSDLPEPARKNVLRGEMLLKEGDFKNAALEFKAALHIAPYAARLYYNSALIYAELKQYAEAIRLMNIYLQAAPDAPDSRAVRDGIVKWEYLMEKENRVN